MLIIDLILLTTDLKGKLCHTATFAKTKEIMAAMYMFLNVARAAQPLVSVQLI